MVRTPSISLVYIVGEISPRKRPKSASATQRFPSRSEAFLKDLSDASDKPSSGHLRICRVRVNASTPAVEPRVNASTPAVEPSANAATPGVELVFSTPRHPK